MSLLLASAKLLSPSPSAEVAFGFLYIAPFLSLFVSLPLSSVKYNVQKKPSYMTVK